MKYVKRVVLIFLVILFLGIGVVFVIITFYKKEMAKMLTDNLKESYGLILKSEDVKVSFFSNWPNASILFKDIYLANNLCKDEPLLKASSVSLSFNLRRLLNKEFIVKSVAISDATINLVKNKEGIENFKFRKKDSLATGKSSIKFEIGKISVTNTDFNFLNKQKNKKIELSFIDNTIRLTHFADGLDATLTGNLFVKGLLFREEKGAFLSAMERKW